MKTKIKILILLLTLSLGAYAKSQSGIYMNVADYQNNKLTYETGCVKGSVHLHDFFWNMTTIKVVNDGKKYILKKDDVYGYRDCNNDVYRFYNNLEYRIAEAGNIYIYVRRESIAQNKNNTLVNVYYFSTTPGGAILPLTVRDLKNAYNDNSDFIDLIDKFFGGADVRAYDDVHNTFKINYLFSKTLK